MNIIKKLYRLKSILLILGLVFAADLLTIFHISTLGLADILWIVLAIPILGSLVLSIFLDADKFEFQEWFIYCAGVGLTTLMFVGLLVNTIGLWLNFPVLKTEIILPLINLIIIGLIILVAKSRLSDIPKRLFPEFVYGKSLLRKTRIVLPLLFPILAVLGAMRLNSGGGDAIAISALVLVCIYPILLITFTRKIYSEEIITSLFSIALALGLSVSMRSNYLIGFDIHQEYQIFSAVIRDGLWHPHLFNNVYNACLSITVLPAVLKSLMPISSVYLFKFCMQLIFGIMPLIVFVIANRILKNKKLAYLAALFFVVQGPLIYEFPGLIRQQIGLMFFGLIFASAMSKRLTKTNKSVLLIIFGISMVTSHYSTTYVAITLLLLMVILKPFFLWVRYNLLKNNRYRGVKNQQINWYISPIIVVLILLSAFLWYGETLQSTGGVFQKVSISLENFSSIFKSDSHSEFVTSTFGFGSYKYDTGTLEQISKEDEVAGGLNPTSSQYTPQPASSKGATLDSSLKSTLFNFEHKFIPLFAGAIVAIGLIFMLIKALFNRGSMDEGLLATGAGCLFILLALLPDISQDYNLERLYQQLLVLISPAFIYGFYVLFKKWVSPKILLIIIISVITFYLLGTSGLADQLVFDISDINLVNNGVNYDHYFTTDGEVFSLLWLQNEPGASKINIDRYSVLNAKAYTIIPVSRIREGVFPSEITPTSYVYASSANIHKGLAFDLFQNNIITFDFPLQYLNDYKNTVYSNQNSEIYK